MRSVCVSRARVRVCVRVRAYVYVCVRPYVRACVYGCGGGGGARMCVCFTVLKIIIIELINV